MIAIKSFDYNDITEADSSLLYDLLSNIWSDIDKKPIHLKEMNAISFCAIDDDKFISYVGVISWNIQVEKEIFKMCALSCVCTHPSYRKKGIGRKLVKEATESIYSSNHFDIGLFTCSSENIPFYKSIGRWEICPRLILKESNRENAYVSDKLKLNVFRLLISEKAFQYASYFDSGTVILNLPEGQFI